MAQATWSQGEGHTGFDTNMAQSDVSNVSYMSCSVAVIEIVTVITARSFDLQLQLPPRLQDVVHEDHGLVWRTLGFVGFWYSMLAARETEEKCSVGHAIEAFDYYSADHDNVALQ